MSRPIRKSRCYGSCARISASPERNSAAASPPAARARFMSTARRCVHARSRSVLSPAPMSLPSRGLPPTPVCRRAIAPGAGRVDQNPGAAMRLLSVRHDHDRRGAVAGERQSHACRDRRSDRQSLSMRYLRPGSQSHPVAGGESLRESHEAQDLSSWCCRGDRRSGSRLSRLDGRFRCAGDCAHRPRRWQTARRMGEDRQRRHGHNLRAAFDMGQGTSHRAGDDAGRRARCGLVPRAHRTGAGGEGVCQSIPCGRLDAAGLAAAAVPGSTVSAGFAEAARFVNLQITGGSTAVRFTGQGMRVVGAAARAMLRRRRRATLASRSNEPDGRRWRRHQRSDWAFGAIW